MNAAEVIGVIGAIVSFLLSCLVAIVSWTFVTFRTDTNGKLKTLEEQNRTQAIEIAGLKKDGEHAGESSEALVRSIDKLDDKIEGFSKELGRFGGILEQLSRRLTGSGGIPRQP